MGRNWAYFCSMGSGFQDTGRFLKLPYLGMKLGHWPKLHIYTLFYPRVSKLSLFSLYEQRFPRRYSPIFKNCHIWAWNLAISKTSSSSTIHPFSTPGGRNWAYFRSTGSGFWDTEQFSKLPYLGWNLANGQSSRKCISYRAKLILLYCDMHLPLQTQTGATCKTNIVRYQAFCCLRKCLRRRHGRILYVSYLTNCIMTGSYL